MPVKPSRNELLYFIRQEIKDCSDDSQTMYPKYIQTAVRSLSTGNMPIIFSGEVTNFIQLITQIWKVDFPTLRENISFQIAFTPNDIQQNTSFVFAPNEFLDKWITYPIINDKEDFLIQIENEVEELLLGNSESNTFLSFLKDLSTTPDSYKTISICHRTYNLYNKLNTCSVSETLQLIRSIATISPQTNESHVKAKAIDRLCFLLPTVSEDEIKGLRNIDFSAFSDGLKKIVSSIDQFLDNQFQSSNPKLEQLSQFLLEVFEKQENVKWWRNAIEDKFISILKIISDFSIIWELIGYENNLLFYFESYIDISYDKEYQILRVYPDNINIELAKKLIEFAKKRKWYRLYATVNRENNTPQKALLEQVSFEKDIDLKDQNSGLYIILDNLSDKDFITIAVHENVDKLNQIAAGKCYNNPLLLNSLEVQIPAWRNIWIYTLGKTDDLTFGLSNPQSTVNSIFDLLLKDILIDDLIIEKISKLVYANIKNYPKRRQLWDKIPSKYRAEFVLKTADAVIKSILNGNNENIEPILERKITSDDYMVTICFQNTLKSILLIYDKFPNLDEKYLLSAINNSPDNLDRLVSDKLGILVRQKSWQKSADAIFEKAKSKSSFQVALNQCSYLIPRWKRFFNNHLFNDIFSENDYYDFLYKLAIELYEKGPEENKIWKRAGGDVSILTNNFNRQEQWYAAIQELRNGGSGKKITLYSLLEKMKEDYPYRFCMEINKLMEYFKKQ
jgi:hypothetical protein